MKIAVVGTGYVGLVSGACFADWGYTVVCVDKDARKIEGLRRGSIPIFEPGLDVLVARNMASGRLSFTNDISDAVGGADAVFMAVGTPPRPQDGNADLSCVYAATQEIAAAITGPTVIVTKSTVPVGTGDVIERLLVQAGARHIPVVSNPEFLREGAAIADFQRPDRIVIGTDDARAREVLLAIYQPLTVARVPVIFTQRRTSELIKYAANAFLATKVSFINELADLCEQVGASVDDLALGMGLDHRIGVGFLHAGPGYGGSCFPKDTLALLRTAEESGVDLKLVKQAVAVNNMRKPRMALKVAAAVGGSVHGLTIAVLGLTFKPNTDDMRDAPSLDLIAAMQKAGAKIRAYDPAGMPQASALLTEVEFLADPYSCAQGADAVVLMTEWDSLISVDLARLRQAVRRPVIVDLRNALDAKAAERLGFTMTCVGRPSSLRQPTVTTKPSGPNNRDGQSESASRIERSRQQRGRFRQLQPVSHATHSEVEISCRVHNGSCSWPSPPRVDSDIERFTTRPEAERMK